MLIYSKKVTIEATGTEPTKTVTRLFGTTNTVPSESDEQLVFKDETGAELDADTVYGYKFYYNKDKTIFANDSKLQVVGADDQAVNVYLADGTPVISNLVSFSSSVDLSVCSGRKSTSYDVSSSVDIIITKQWDN